MLDVYLPPESDKREKRPVVVYTHGGGFNTGDKSIAEAFLRMLTQRGYAVFAINYRLTADYWFGKPVPLRKELDAQEDLRAAIRFVRSKAEEYNLDSDKVIAAGDSAGGITSLFTAYVEEA